MEENTYTSYKKVSNGKELKFEIMLNCKYEAILLNVNFNFKRISKHGITLKLLAICFETLRKYFI